MRIDDNNSPHSEERLAPQPVQANTLVEGNIYYCVQFLDDEMLIPEMRPLVFIGHNLSPGDSSEAYFQDVASYRKNVRWKSGGNTEEAAFECFPITDDYVGAIYEYEQALQNLTDCSLRRKRVSVHDTSPR